MDAHEPGESHHRCDLSARKTVAVCANPTGLKVALSEVHRSPHDIAICAMLEGAEQLAPAS